MVISTLITLLENKVIKVSDRCMEIDAVVNDEIDLYKSDSSLQHIKN